MKLLTLLIAFILSTSSFAADNCPSRSEIKKAIHRHQVLICMTQKEVMKSAPVKYNDDFEADRWTTEKGNYALWRYYKRKDYWPYAIKFRNGRVIAIISSPSAYDAMRHD